MFKRENRLSTNFEFNITRKYGQKYTGENFFIYVLKPKNYKGPTKVGIVVSNKICKIAVKRNRIKRVFREVLRKNLKELGDNCWIVVHPKKISLGKNHEEISTDFNKTLQKISLPN